MDTDIGEVHPPAHEVTGGDEVIVFDMKQMEQRQRRQSQIVGREGISNRRRVFGRGRDYAPAGQTGIEMQEIR